MFSLLTDKQKECGKIKGQSQQNIVKLSIIVWGQRFQALQSEAMSDTKYEEMDETYNIVRLTNKLIFMWGC